EAILRRRFADDLREVLRHRQRKAEGRKRARLAGERSRNEQKRSESERNRFRFHGRSGKRITSGGDFARRPVACLLPAVWSGIFPPLMSYLIREWLNLGLRWFHVFAAIMWVGQTFFFTWLDRRFHSGEKNVWMVHSGGFYIVDKQKVPELRDQTLHWFRWEAALTWLSGICLLVLVYYTGGLMPTSKQVAISVAMIIGGWLLYDLMWISPLARN